MPTTNLTIPILVLPTSLEGQPAYQVQPVFFGQPVGIHRRYNEALSLFKKQMVRRFSTYTLTRSTADHLFWFKFGPNVALHHFNLEFSIGSHYVKGRFGVASFDWHGQLFACLYNFDNFIFLVNTNERGKIDLKAESERVIKELLKQHKQDEGSDFDLSPFFSDKKEFLATAHVEVNYKLGKFYFELDSSNALMAAFRQHEAFDGGEELEKVATNSCGLFPEGLNRAWYRTALVEQLYHQIFDKKHIIPIALVGASGVGKHAILHEVVYRYVSEIEKNETANSRRQSVWNLNPNRVIAGMSIVGQWEKRLEAILQYVQKPAGREDIADKIVVDNPVALLRIGKSAGSELTLATVIKPYLEKRQVQLVIIATPEEWKIVQESDRGFADLFQVLRVEEPDTATALKMVLKNRWQLELQHGCSITVPAIAELFTIQRNYLKNKALPGSVMKLLAQLVAKFGQTTIDAPQVREAFKSFSGIREQIFEEDTTLEKDALRQMLEVELVGQPEAVEALAGAIHLVKARLTDHKCPMASFLFVGPTGVGKTHAAKLLCKTILGSDTKLMRFDMNEYIDVSALHRLIGDFHNPEGQLTGKVRYQPFGVLLLDEIEKAHPSIHDLLLQVLDDARLTDSLGRTVDFSNTIIVMTSNLGAREAGSQIGFGQAQGNISAVYRKAVEQHFRPEFVNRIDRIVVFNPLAFEEVRKIAQLQIRELLQRDGFVRRTTIVNVEEKALDWVARRGFDSRMGGRSLKRQIERDLTLLSAEQLIQTNSNTPIILDISLVQEHLVPHISPIQFVKPFQEDWIPEIPTEQQAAKYFGKLLQRIEKMEQEVADFEKKNQKKGRLYGLESQQADWKHYDFKNKVAIAKESIQFKMLKLRERTQASAPVLPFRLKRVYLNNLETGQDKARREALRDKYFQEEGIKSLVEAYRHVSPQFDSFQTEYLVSFLDLNFLEIMLDGFLEQKTDKIQLILESCVTYAGNAEMDFLVKQYSRFLSSMDIPHTVSTDGKLIEAEEHGLATLLKGEIGLHLFYNAEGTPIPIRLFVKKAGTTPGFFPYVIRIYDGKDSQADLRTGYTNAYGMSPDEMKLLLFAGMKGAEE